MQAGPVRKHSTARRFVAVPAIMVVAAIGLASCSGDDAANTAATSSIDSSIPTAPSSSIAITSSLDASTVDGLLYMREEEKLARDVYEFLGAKWNLPIFGSIAASEQSHMDSIATLLTRYGIPDPVADSPRGEFTIPVIQDLYDQLVALGNTSVVDALTVGAMIEDLDIVDLQNRATPVPDIQAVYNNLEKGSRNHLRTFTAQLGLYGATYSPVYLSQAEYDAIISSSSERGNTN
jgi:hypothetical protein